LSIKKTGVAAGVDNGEDLDEALLKNMYGRIRNEEFTTLDDHMTQVAEVQTIVYGVFSILPRYF